MDFKRELHELYTADPSRSCSHDFIAGQGVELAGKHHEVYLSHPTHSAPEKMKTIMRQPVR